MSPSLTPSQVQVPSLNPSFQTYKSSQVKKKLNRKIHSDDSFVSRAERVVKGTSDSIMKTYNVLSDAIGERPYGTQKISERKQVRRYVAFVRDNTQAWTQLIQENGLRSVAEYAIRMERLCEKYPEDASYMEVE